MIRNTWEAVFEVVESIVTVVHNCVEVVYAITEDVKNLGYKVGDVVAGKESDTVEMDADDIAELITNTRNDCGKKSRK